MVTFLLGVQEVAVSNLGIGIDYPDRGFCGIFSHAMKTRE
jgi:hypothetical protein